MRIFALLLAALVTASAVEPRTSAAQSPTERRSLEAIRDSLSTVDDSVVLLAREKVEIDTARVDRTNPMRHLALGFLAYRLGEVTGNKQHFDDAAGEFEWASELKPDWPYPWYGLGLSELAVGESDVIGIENIRQALGVDYLTKAADAFARATQADPTFAVAVQDLAETAMRQRLHARLDVALHALREAAATAAGADNPTIQLLRGRVEREAGSPDSALASFERYLAVGGDSGIGMLEEARTDYLRGDERAARATFYRGAMHLASDSARALYRSDIAWIADSNELAAFDATPDSSMAAWLHQFWAKRDAADLRRPGARLAEHYRRYFYVLQHFRLTSPHRHYGIVDQYRSSQHEVDDRGVVYMREGEPDDRARFNAQGVEPNESWLYHRSDGDLVLHFVAIGSVQDYKLVPSLADVFGPQAEMALQAGDSAEFRRAADIPVSDDAWRVASDLFSSRIELDSRYRRLVTMGTIGFGPALSAERSRGERAIAEATTTDSYTLQFDGHVDPTIQSYVVSDTADQPTLLVVFGVPGRALRETPVGLQVAYPLGIRVVAAADTGAPRFLDTVRTFAAPHVLTGDEYLTGYVTLRVPPGSLRAGVVVRDPGAHRGDVIRLDSVVAPDFARDTLSLSDIVLGDPRSTLVWPNGADTLHLSGLGRFTAGDTLGVYYEIHGLAAGRSYRARIEVRKEGGGSIFAKIAHLFGGGHGGVRLRYEATATGPLMRRHETIGLGSLGAGDYTVTLAIEDVSSGARAERSARFKVVDR